MVNDTDAGLRLLSLRTQRGSPFLTYVAIKEHRTKEGEAEHGPALFISGLPLNFDADAVAEVFACFGEVLQVVLHGNKRSGMVLFATADAIASALSAAVSRSLVEWSLPTSEEPAGVKAWVRAHKALRPGNKVLQKELDAWVAAYEDEDERKQKEKTAAMAEDGWTVVVRSKGRAKTTEEGGMTVKGGGVAAAAAKAKGSTLAAAGLPLEDKFYRFQQREKRRSELLELRHNFEQDRKRIAELRHSRNFKPWAAV